MFEISFKLCHMTGLWVWSSFEMELRMRLHCIHFQQILNQNQTKLFVANIAIAGQQNYIGIQYSHVQEVGK
jgi:hypothetical protein